MTKAAYETGLVESGLRNIGYGSGSSVNWRQETASSYGSVKRRMNLTGSVDRFFNEATAYARSHPGAKSGQIAQAVQRSAFPGRYAQVGHQAAKLTRRALNDTGSGDTFNFRDTQVSSTPGVDRSLERRKAILSYFLAQGHQGAGALQYAGVDPSPYYGQNGLSALAQTLSGLDDTPSSLKVTTKNRAVTVGGARHGHVAFAPGADRPGVHTAPAVKRFTRKLSRLAGERIVIGTGTNHSHLTVNGNVSDHWSGHAGDIPAVGKRLVRLGRLALIAAGMPRRQALKQTGGLFNVNGHQVIFNTHEGGDHTNHLHVSAY